MLSSPFQPFPTAVATAAAAVTPEVESLIYPSLVVEHILSASTPSLPKTVVLIDPLSTGTALQQRLFDLGYRIILVWSDRTQAASREKHYQVCGAPKDKFAAVIEHSPDNILQTVQEILHVTTNITALMCGSEYGVLLEDNLAKSLNALLGTTHLRSSGVLDVQSKVDKHAQSSILRNAGMDAVREKLAYSQDDVLSFLQEWTSSTDEFAPVVVKPQTGAGSVGVMFCHTEAEVLEAFHKIVQGEHKVHLKHKYCHYSEAGVLLQEHLSGTEFIVDTVVFDGLPKTAAMFKYDKRPYNGAPFVCFGKELVVLADDPKHREILDYVESAIAALGFRNGAVHSEVMYTNRGPVMVEINCRLHGGNGAWVKPAETCMGYSQLGVMMDAYLNEERGLFSSIPNRPENAMRRCHQVKMRSHIEGILDHVLPVQLARIMSLSSYVSHFFSVQPGDKLSKTIDIPTVPGEVTLIHKDAKVLDEDYQVLNEILAEGLFVVVR